MKRIFIGAFLLGMSSISFAAGITLFWNDHPATKEERSDQESFLRTFEAFGLHATTCAVSGFEEALASGQSSVIVVPITSANSLSASQIGSLKKWVDAGGSLVFDHESALSAAFKINSTAGAERSQIINHLRHNTETRWPDQPAVPAINAAAIAVSTAFYTSDGNYLVIGGNSSSGKVVFFGGWYDDLSAHGYGRYNDLPLIMDSFLHVRPQLRSRRAEAYFDPGDHFGKPIEPVLVRLENGGLRALHVGAWYDDGPSPYDYATLIKKAHAHGITVYAWFEWPHVTKKFWDDHPECREKTSELADAAIDWRLLINLQNPACRQKVMQKTEQLLTKYPWDGVDIAEIYLEPVDGLDKVENFTPLNDDVRADFKKKYSFDPVELFRQKSNHYWKKDKRALAEYFSYRRSLTAELTEYFLKNISGLSQRDNRQWEIVLTVTDVLANPKLADNIAVDLNANIRLAQAYGATMEIQDEYFEWGKTPDRYLTLGESYRRILGGRSFLIDINVVDEAHADNPVGFATDKQTGTELFELWRTASASTPRIIMYSDATVEPEDWRLLPYAMASGAAMKQAGDKISVTSSYPVQYEKPKPDYFTVDGKDWPCQNDRAVWLPSGTHVLGTAKKDRGYEANLIFSMDGDILGADFTRRAAQIKVRELFRSYWKVKPGTRVHIDGSYIKSDEFKRDGIFSVPAGVHSVELHAR